MSLHVENRFASSFPYVSEFPFESIKIQCIQQVIKPCMFRVGQEDDILPLLRYRFVYPFR